MQLDGLREHRQSGQWFAEKQPMTRAGAHHEGKCLVVGVIVMLDASRLFSGRHVLVLNWDSNLRKGERKKFLCSGVGAFWQVLRVKLLHALMMAVLVKTVVESVMEVEGGTNLDHLKVSSFEK